MSPKDAAWEKWHRLGLTTHKPIGMMNAILDEFAVHHSLKESVRAFVTCPDDSPEKAIKFAAMVRELSQ